MSKNTAVAKIDLEHVKGVDTCDRSAVCRPPRDYAIIWYVMKH